MQEDTPKPLSPPEAAPPEAPLPQEPVRNIKDFTLEGLTDWMKARGQPAFRARQVFQWLYQKHVRNFDEMTNISKDFRELLRRHFHLGLLEVAAVKESADGSRKFAFALEDGKLIEAVLMPNNTHFTVCISSQVGCAMGCGFCSTARMGLQRNLTTGEIVQQAVELARQAHLDGDDRIIRNIVFMGMGEPLHNYDNLVSALHILQDDHGFGLSSRRITVSTSGLVPGINRLARDDVRIMLAVSLNGVTDEMRSRLMPVNRRWKIAELLQACRNIPSPNRTRITFEYVMLEGETDGLENARKLVRLLHGLKCKVNLIPYNPHPGSPYRPSTPEHCREFQRVLLEKGLLATLRISKGQDIQAACGQLITGIPAARGAKRQATTA
ncbi:MAG: 23S rRNA (adenine(2503)-C(2))-methyltransferase RlmN [Deltaproteobacteria bacterium]|nr:23S rRNA (adenine(2503)-C(2))-methyltransferase RlmN [Deltaproteobacteria bacterium]